MSDGFERTSSGPTALVVLVGVLLAAATIHTGATATSFATMLEAALLTILTVAVLGRAVTLHASDRRQQDDWRVAGWCLAGALTGAILAGIVLMRIALRGDAIAAPIVLVELFAGIGAVAGLFVGGDQVRAIAAGRTSERQQTSELLEKRESERLTFLNNLLRHNVLNGMNIVLGYTTAIEDDVDDRDEYVDRIRTRSEAIVELVQNVQVLVRSLSGDLAVEAVNLTDTARAQLDRARQNHDATFHTDLEPDVTVATTPFVSAAIENLLTNAVTHNDAPDPEVRLTVERRGDDGIVTISDNGPGIPPDVVDTYFGDHPDDHFVGDGLGLYLVDELVTTHGGTIDIDSSEDGTTITLTFPLTTEHATSTATTDDPNDPVAA